MANIFEKLEVAIGEEATAVVKIILIIALFYSLSLACNFFDKKEKEHKIEMMELKAKESQLQNGNNQSK